MKEKYSSHGSLDMSGADREAKEILYWAQELNNKTNPNLEEGISNPVSSLYLVYREYGGPEEGGWWYDRYEYIAPEEEASNYLGPEGMQELEQYGEVDASDRRGNASYKILGEKYPKALDGTDNYEPYS